MGSFAFAAVFLAIGVLCLVLSSHAGDALSLQIRGSGVAGKFRITGGIRRILQLVGVVVIVLGIGVAVLEVVPIGSNAGPGKGASGSSPDSGRTKESRESEEPAGEPSSNVARTTTVWKGCDFAVAPYDELEIDPGSCPRTVDSGGNVVFARTTDYGVRLSSGGDSTLSFWDRTSPPTGSECRASVDRSGSSSTPVELGPGDVGKGACIRIGESRLYVYLEITGVSRGDDNPRITGAATGWQ